MKIKQRIKQYLFLCIFLICFLGLSNNVYAKVLKTGSFSLSPYHDFDCVYFEVAEPGVLVVDVDVRIPENKISYDDALNVQLKYGINIFEDDTIEFEDGLQNETWQTYFYTADKVRAGDAYSYYFNNEGYHVLDGTYKIQWFPSYTNSISITSAINMRTEEYREIKYAKFPVDSYTVFTSVTSTNKKVAEAGWTREGIAIYATGAGSCYINLQLYNGPTYRVKVDVTNPATKIKYTTCTMNTGHSIQNAMLYTNEKVKWSTSNKKIATVSKNGKIVAKKIGKCTITAKIGKKKYKCKVNVVRRNPNFVAYINDYNTRNKYFEVVVENFGDRTLTISPSGAKAYNYDYKSFDRKLSFKSTSIKPGKYKILKFKIKGRNTWYDYEDFWIGYKFKYDGKTYSARMYSEMEDSEFKNGKKYYYTYGSEIEFE